MRVLFAAGEERWLRWKPALRAALPEAELLRQGDPETIDIIITAPGGEVQDFRPYRNLRLVQSLWAGVEYIVGNDSLTQPLARLVDPGQSQGMREYCAGWALRLHLGMESYRQDGVWRNDLFLPLASGRRITVLGAGALGGTVAEALTGLGFDIATWSASGRGIGTIPAYGEADLPAALARAEIAILILPNTPGTRDILNARTLSLLPRGAAIINPGRGTLIEDEALLAALDQGLIGHAVLDVFRTEPLPQAHPYWAHPRVTVTPHCASATRPSSAAPMVAENLRRVMRGDAPLFLVDRNRGY
ncbi:MAG: 2-hydroxyacid dehydrogenase [Paracoccus sp. (in: a-proteobacteria)]